MPVLQTIGDLGPLILAIVAVVAIFWPSMIKLYSRPKFRIEILPDYIDDPSYPQYYKEIQLTVVNIGRTVAHRCRVMITIKNSKGDMVATIYLPWIDNSLRSKIRKQNGRPITYELFDIYPNESLKVKFLYYHKVSDSSEHLLAVYGSGGISPFYDDDPKKDEDRQMPPLFEFSDYYFSPIGGVDLNEPYLERKETYSVEPTVFSEDKNKQPASLFFEYDGEHVYCGKEKDNLSLTI